MKSILTCLLLLGVGQASAAEIYKCKTAEGGFLYSERPCSGAPMKPLVPSATVDFRNLSVREANTAHDCVEGWENLSDPDNPTRVRIDKSDNPRIQAEFEKLCPRFGFRLPVGPGTDAVNGPHAKKLLEILHDRYPNTPSYPRVYSGKYRSPPLFTGY